MIAEDFRTLSFQQSHNFDCVSPSCSRISGRNNTPHPPRTPDGFSKVVFSATGRAHMNLFLIERSCSRSRSRSFQSRPMERSRSRYFPISSRAFQSPLFFVACVPPPPPRRFGVKSAYKSTLRRGRQGVFFFSRFPFWHPCRAAERKRRKYYVCMISTVL